MALTLTDFILEEQQKLQKFEQWWQAMHHQNPGAFPLTMADGNEGLWSEQFQEFDEAWLDQVGDKGASR